MFNVICLETASLVIEDGRVVSFETGALAAAYAADLTAKSGKKHQPRRALGSVDWRKREQERFDNGTYQALPTHWTDSYWWREVTQSLQMLAGEMRMSPDQWKAYSERIWDAGFRAKFDGNEERAKRLADAFPHVSNGKQGKVAYTVDAEHGEADRQTVVTPGVFLQRFFGDVLSTEQITEHATWFADAFGEPAELHTTQDADEIEHVYTNGPSSCMSRDASDYNGHCHPVRVYAGPDLAVAYIKNGRDEISARCVVWPEKKRYSRIYGDEYRMGVALQRAGYALGSLRGARIQLIEDMNGNGLIMPYVDNYSRCEIDGAFVRIGSGGIECQSTNGVSEQGELCARCGTTMDDETSSYIDSRDERWCDCCTSDHAFYCEVAGETIANDDGVYMEHDGGVYWSQRRFAREGVCTDSGENWPIDETVTLADGSCWSQDEFDRDGWQCPQCGECYADDDKPAECCGNAGCPIEDDDSDSEAETADEKEGNATATVRAA